MIDRENEVSDPRLRRLSGRGLADQHPDVIRYRPEPRPYVIEVQAESRWSLKRILAWLIGVPLFAFAALAFLGSLNPNPARDAARTARDAVASQLKDAGSAEYRNINVFRLPAGNFLVCGEVNARNSFGGMAGFARFVVPGSGLPVIESSMINGSTFNSLWSEIGCDGSKGAAVERDVLVLG
jgi:hypothetical protein